MKNLIIVESPAKAKTIQKYLKDKYKVVASFGHVRDLPKSRLNVDIKNDFKPTYATIKARRELLKSLKEEVKKGKKVLLATDPDREGEAISWHLAQVLKLDLKDKNRVTFNEITQNGVKTGINNPREIDMNLVNAQQARRILDRIVGYKISPLLWKKVRRGLSAGRVQSVAVKIIVDREKQIREFVPKEYWTIESILSKQKGKKQFNAQLSLINGKKADISTKDVAEKIVKELKHSDFIVENIKNSTKKRTAPVPYITSTMQQDAYNKISFSSKKTMKVAQELYEGVNTKLYGTQGLITYMRTDSLRISEEAKTAANEYIKKTYGEQYVGYEKKLKKNTNVQDAHEAIRPTNLNILPESVEQDLTKDQYKLYKLIWERFVASRMADAVYNITSAEIKAGTYTFSASGSRVSFLGYTAVYKNNKEQDEQKELPELEVGEKLSVKKIEPLQHFTQPPARFTEASLIKALEEKGIGRPSTYAPTISTIMAREYVIKEGKSLKPTDLGEIINGILEEYFKNIVDENFTANMETGLDSISLGKLDMVALLKEFYGDFEKTLKNAEENMDPQKIEVPSEHTDEICEVCGAHMKVKFGKFGKFLACERYPECTNTKKFVKPSAGICNKCGGKILIKKSKTGRTYYGCENNPTCDFMTWDIPIADACPKCGATLFRTKGKNHKIICRAENCGYIKEGNNE